MQDTYEYRIAASADELEGAFRVRHRVFVEEICAPGGREDDHIVDARATHVIATLGGQVVGTVRVQGVAPPSPRDDRGAPEAIAMAGELHYDYSPLRQGGVRFVEIARSSVLPAHRNATVNANLWKAVVLFARSRAFDHFVSIVQVGYTDSLADAHLVMGALARHGMIHPRYALPARTTAAGPERPRYAILTDAQRAAPETIRVPAAMRLFRRFGMRACGRPVFMPEIERVGLLMLAGPDTFPASALRFFDEPDPSIDVGGPP